MKKTNILEQITFKNSFQTGLLHAGSCSCQLDENEALAINIHLERKHFHIYKWIQSKSGFF